MFITSGSDWATERGGQVMANRSGTRAATVSQGAGVGAGAKRTYGGGSDQRCSAGGDGHARARVPEPGERSVSAPQVRMRCDCNLGNCACERCHGARDDNWKNCTARE
eukprot:2840779-Pleurochrysis_carterae.AAC.3